MSEALRDDEAGAIQIGATDHGMVRLIITLRDHSVDLDFEADEAEEIAEELRAAAEMARRKAKNRR